MSFIYLGIWIFVDRVHGLSNNYFPYCWICFNSFIASSNLGLYERLEIIKANYGKSWIKKKTNMFSYNLLEWKLFITLKHGNFSVNNS